MKIRFVITGLLLFLSVLNSGILVYGISDWPMYRFDKTRSANTPHQLSEKMHLQWVLELPEPQRAWPLQQDDFEKLAFDKSYEPVVYEDMVYVSSMVTDRVEAYGVETGEKRWRYQTDGPVRLAPLVWEGKVYAASDDGLMHCIDARTGELIWQFQAAPGNRKVLGNERLISMWPLRGGPVIADGILYFAAGLWPHEGVLIYAIDAETATVQWINSGSSSDLAVDSKRYYSFGGVVPQGQLAVAGERLIVPGGRTVPAVFDRHTGEQLFYNAATHSTGKGAGGHKVFVHGDWFFNERDRYLTHMYSMADGAQYGTAHIDIVSDQGLFGVDGDYDKNILNTDVRDRHEDLYGVELKGGWVNAYSSDIVKTDKHDDEPEPVLDRRGREIEGERLYAASRAPSIEGRLVRGSLSEYYDLQLSGRTKVEDIQRLHLKAGSTIFGSGNGGRILALGVEDITKEAEVLWTKKLDGEIFSMLAARDRLFVVTNEGRIYCFGPEKVDPVVHQHIDGVIESQGDGWAERAGELLGEVDVRGGYGLMFGIGSGRLLDELLAQSELHITAFDPDAGKVEELRDRYTQAGVYGSRVAIHEGNAMSHRLPPYIASMVVSEDPVAAGFSRVEDGVAFARALFHPLRPFGGIAYVAIDGNRAGDFATAIEQAELENATVTGGKDYVLLSRPGALPGSDSWTHQYANAANSSYSNDSRVKAPLGIAWFGGEPNHKTLPRHMFGPNPQVVEGRLIILGPHHVSARCVYTGVELWATELPGVGEYFTSWKHEEEIEKGDRTVYFPSAPGANFIGSPLVSAADNIYIIYDDKCLKLDAATGEKVSVFDMPDREDLQQKIRDPFTEKMLQSYGAQLQKGDQLTWGNIRYEGDYLIAAAYPHMFDDKQPGRENNWNATSSEFIVVMDRHDGTVSWVRQARYGFRHNAIIAGSGKVFVIDNLSDEILQMLSRRGIEPDIEPEIRAVDIATGEVVWTFTENVFGTMLAYSATHDVLVQSGRPGGRGTLPDEPRDHLMVLRGSDGEKLWTDMFRYRRSPLGLHDSWSHIIGSTGEGAVNMFTGERMLQTHPLTGLQEEWTWLGALRCGTQNFSKHLALFRSGAAGFTDFAGLAGSGNIPGFRPGCTNNLIAADGIFNAPEYSRTCACSYQLQTSVGLVHMPEAEMWTYNAFSDPYPGTIRRVGINFSAPASRYDSENKVLWLEYPALVGPVPEIPVEVETIDNPRWFHQHSSLVNDENNSHSWVAASGVEGVKRVRVDGLVTEGNPAHALYKVRLYFTEPDQGIEPGQRVFDVLINGNKVLENMDVTDQAGGSKRLLRKEFTGVKVNSAINIEFSFSNNNNPAVISGVEILIHE